MQNHLLSPLFALHLAEISSRTSAALEATGFDSLVIQAGEPLQLFLDDQNYPYKVHPPFKLWAPLLNAPGSLIFFEPGNQPTLIFYVATDFWHQAAQLPESWWPSSFKIMTVHSRAQARAALPKSLARTAWIGDLLPELTNWGLAAINSSELLWQLDFARARKTAYEIACLREANWLGVQGHAAAERAFRAGGSEYEIHNAFASSCGQREQELPYNSIVALNKGGAVLHYQVLQRCAPIKINSLLIDAGANFAGYGSDITRTYSYNDPDFSALIAAMHQLQQRLCDQAKPGKDWREIHQSAVAYIANLLVESNIVNCSAAEAIDNGIARLFFPHGIGHLLGLQVHDVGGRMSGSYGIHLPRPTLDYTLRLTRVLEPNFVVTMEPGVYFIDSLLDPVRMGPYALKINWKRVDSLSPFGGIRIEDNLVITAQGCENLTRNAQALLHPK
ncbi:MAG: Xaa-Pro dipeptidase [Gammaproteobacteria bacterium]|nr:Xaa-Pro dipeptidase [Gammaproteobacteria bacterium]